eukprot:3862375-Amphidinium_carterae.1
MSSLPEPKIPRERKRERDGNCIPKYRSAFNPGFKSASQSLTNIFILVRINALHLPAQHRHSSKAAVSQGRVESPGTTLEQLSKQLKASGAFKN